jgi:hypothetical protein
MWSFPLIRPVIRPVIHPWMASYNNPLQMWRLKNSCSLAICQKLKTNFKKLKIVEKKLEKQEKKFQIKKEEDKLLINE